MSLKSYGFRFSIPDFIFEKYSPKVGRAERFSRKLGLRPARCSQAGSRGPNPKKIKIHDFQISTNPTPGARTVRKHVETRLWGCPKKVMVLDFRFRFSILKNNNQKLDGWSDFPENSSSARRKAPQAGSRAENLKIKKYRFSDPYESDPRGRSGS